MKQTSITKISDFSDQDEAPPITQADFDRATFRIAGKPVSRAEWQAAAQSKIGLCNVNLDLDAPIVAHFKALAGDRDYGKLINDTLRRIIEDEHRETDPQAIVRDELKQRLGSGGQ